MSDGPIKRDREAFARRPPVSTNAKTSLHLSEGPGGGTRAYCGHRGGTLTRVLADVTCSVCTAAWNADCADADAKGATRDLGRELEGRHGCLSGSR
jgi:hypothetical protein